ncbi:MAG: tetratricopeptide (TPR) repeat protein [Planctomycetota bacterium]|jgi:tetratricopeptide (TPR) repeat protein
MSMRDEKPAQPAQSKSPASGGYLHWISAIVLVLASLLHLRALHAPFVFDDTTAIEQNLHIESLTPLSRAMDAPEGTGADGRPLVALSLALNYALGERRVEGYHVFNVAIHALATLALYLCALAWLCLVGIAGAQRIAWAFVLALLWTLHPLHIAALNHVVYRNEAMMGLAYFGTLLAALRGFAAAPGSSARRLFFALSIVACAIGTGCKEVIVSAPCAVLLIDRTFVSRTIKAAVSSHRFLYIGLFSTWPLLAWIVSDGERGESVGMNLQGVPPIAYLLTQGGVILHYIKLALWPDVLCLDYDDWGIASDIGSAFPEALIVALAVALAFIFAWKRRPLAVLASLFFIVLAPTSSIVPLAGAVVGEHRMYVPLAVMIGMLGVLVARLAPAAILRPRSILMLAVFALPLGWKSYQRHGDFSSLVRIWEDTVIKRPENSRAWNTFGTALRAAGHDKAAIDAYRRALDLKPSEYRAAVNLGNLEYEANDLQAAARSYGRAAKIRPDVAETRYYAGSISIAIGRQAEGVDHLRACLSPEMRAPGLITQLRAPAMQTLAWALATSTDDSLRSPAEALTVARELNEMTRSQRPRLLSTLAAAQASNGLFAQAVLTIDKCIERARSTSRPTANYELHRAKYRQGQAWLQDPLSPK